jgi:hypothetical protein
MPTALIQFAAGLCIGLVAYLALDNVQSITSLVTFTSHQNNDNYQCKSIANVGVWRYSVQYNFAQNISTCDSLENILQSVRTLLNDQTVTRLLTMHGYPISKASDFESNCKFVWCFNCVKFQRCFSKFPCINLVVE